MISVQTNRRFDGSLPAPSSVQLVASSSLTSLNAVCVRTDLVLPKVMDDAWVAAAQEAYDHVTADEEEVLVAVAGVGGPTNVFVTRGEGETRPLTIDCAARLTDGGCRSA